jgi:hypothetical protein
MTFVCTDVWTYVVGLTMVEKMVAVMISVTVWSRVLVSVSVSVLVLV